MDTTNVLNRRTALKGLAASAAVAVSSVPAHAAGPTLADLIARHATAYSEMEAANDAAEAAREKFEKGIPAQMVVPTLVSKDGTPNSAHLAGRYTDVEDIAARIEATHAKKLAQLMDDFALADNEPAISAVRSVLDTSKAQCLSVLTEMAERRDAARRDAELDLHEARFDAAADRELEMSCEVLRHVPASDAEWQEKGRWMLKAYQKQGDWFGTPQMEALASSFGMEVA